MFLGELSQKLKDLDRDRPVAVYCASGYRASLAASLLQANGFKKVQNVPGSYAAWAAAEFRVVKPADTDRKAADTNR